MSYRRTLLWGIVFVGLLVAVLQALASVFYLYWVYQWFDVLMHALGGAFVAFLALWAAHGAFERGLFLASYPHLRASSMLLFTVVAALIVGTAWELFEVAVGAPRELNYQFDTSLDLLMDVAGAMTAVGWLYAGRTRRAMVMALRTA